MTDFDPTSALTDTEKAAIANERVRAWAADAYGHLLNKEAVKAADLVHGGENRIHYEDQHLRGDGGSSDPDALPRRYLHHRRQRQPHPRREHRQRYDDLE